MTTQTARNRRFRKRHPGYSVWCNMMRRCYRRKNHNYERYGGRGITVCRRWQRSYKNFLADMGQRPSSRHSVERKKNHLNYTPGNCLWATAKTQSQNTRQNRLITYQGITQCVTEWAEDLGVKRSLIYNRLWRGWPPAETLST